MLKNFAQNVFKWHYFDQVYSRFTRRQNGLLHVTDKAATAGNFATTAAGSLSSSNFTSARRHRGLPSSDLKQAIVSGEKGRRCHAIDYEKKNRKKSRYFRLPPNLAHRKLIALANYVPSSSPLRVLSFTQRFFKNVEKWRCVVRSIWDVFA